MLPVTSHSSAESIKRGKMSDKTAELDFTSTSQLPSLRGQRSQALSTPHKEKGKVKEDYKKEGMFKEKKRLAELSVFGIQVKDSWDSANGRTFPPPPSTPHCLP